MSRFSKICLVVTFPSLLLLLHPQQHLVSSFVVDVPHHHHTTHHPTTSSFRLYQSSGYGYDNDNNNNYGYDQQGENDVTGYDSYLDQYDQQQEQQQQQQQYYDEQQQQQQQYYDQQQYQDNNSGYGQQQPMYTDQSYENNNDPYQQDQPQDQQPQGLILDGLTQEMNQVKSHYGFSESDYLAAARQRAGSRVESLNAQSNDEDWYHLSEQTKQEQQMETGQVVDDWENSAKEAGNTDSQILMFTDPPPGDGENGENGEDAEPKLLLF